MNTPTTRPRVVRLIARLNVGGPAQHVAWLNAGLRDEFESTLIAGNISPGEDEMTDFARAMGVEPVIVAGLSREISIRDLPAAWHVYRLLVQLKPDIVHTHTAKAGTIGRTAATLYRWLTPGTLIGRPRPCRVVHTYHGHVFHSYFGRIKTRLILLIEQVLAKVTDRIVVISPRQLEEIQSLLGAGHNGQFCVIPLGLDLTRFEGWQNRRQILRDEVGAAPDDVLVGIVGRLVDVKNHELFLNSVAEFVSRFAERSGTRESSEGSFATSATESIGSLTTSATSVIAAPARNRRVRFLIIGNGPLQEQLMQQAHDLDLDDHVMFMGLRTDPEVFYPGLDIVMLTSKNEGTPLSLIEAMANGRPVLSTAVGGVCDLLGSRGNASSPFTPFQGEKVADRPDEGEPVADFTLHAHGISAAATPHSLAAGVFQLANDDELRTELGARGEVFVRRSHSKDRLISDIKDLYQNLLSVRW